MICIALSKLYGLPVRISVSMLCAYLGCWVACCLLIFWLVRLHLGKNYGTNITYGMMLLDNWKKPKKYLKHG